PKEFSKRIAAAKPIVEFFLAELAEQERDPHRLLQLAEAIVLPLIAALPSPMEREHFIQSTARSLGLSAEAVRESVNRLPKFSEAVGGTANVRKEVSSARSSTEIRAEQLLAVVHVYEGTPLAARVKSEYCRIIEAQELPPHMLPESILFSTEQMFGEDPDERAADELLSAFEEAVIREAYQEAVANLRRAEASGNVSLVADAQHRCAVLSMRLAAFGN
ncbi:MAG TPA: hypothetical protein VNF51_01605, partial [Candidatus Paceibacterota bacterium]|nr:hypothetical protein [Candidatus Paceibacterota bacterium]